MKLTDMHARWPYRIAEWHANDGTVYHTADIVHPERYWLFRLDDYAVSSVCAGTIWLRRRTVAPWWLTDTQSDTNEGVQR